jgi:hypothetical protein
MGLPFIGIQQFLVDLVPNFLRLLRRATSSCRRAPIQIRLLVISAMALEVAPTVCDERHTRCYGAAAKAGVTVS